MKGGECGRRSSRHGETSNGYERFGRILSRPLGDLKRSEAGRFNRCTAQYGNAPGEGSYSDELTHPLFGDTIIV